MDSIYGCDSAPDFFEKIALYNFNNNNDKNDNDNNNTTKNSSSRLSARITSTDDGALLRSADGAVDGKYILRPQFEHKFKPIAVKPLIHEVRVAFRLVGFPDCNLRDASLQYEFSIPSLVI